MENAGEVGALTETLTTATGSGAVSTAAAAATGSAAVNHNHQHSNVNHSSGGGGSGNGGENQDEEWKPFDSEDHKDYSGLRINRNWKLEDEEDLYDDGDNDEAEKKVCEYYNQYFSFNNILKIESKEFSIFSYFLRIKTLILF